MALVTDRTAGIIGDFGIKAPVTCCATTNIVLNGEQTIDGVLTNESDVLLTGQTDTTENGIYTSDTGDWTRRADFDGSRDARKGTLVKVVSGTANYGYWSVTTSNPVIPDGSMAIAFSRDSSTLAVISAYMQGLLGAANQAALLTAIGFSTFFQTLIGAANAATLRGLLGLGTAAVANTGTTAGTIPILNGSAQLPAVDGSLLTNLVYPILVRQAIQFGPVTGSPGKSDLIPQSQVGATLATGVTLKCGTAATLFSVANGFNSDGSPFNRNWRASADIPVTGLTASQTNYIWVDTVAQTAGFVIVADADQDAGTIPVTNNQYTYDYGGQKNYLGNGATATQTNRLIVAEVDTNGTVVTAIRCRAYNRKFEGTFTATLPATAVTVSATHNLGTKEYTIKFIAENTTSELGYAIGDRAAVSMSGINASYPNPASVKGGKNTASVIGSASTAWAVAHATTGAIGVITPASWKYKFVVIGDY